MLEGGDSHFTQKLLFIDTQGFDLGDCGVLDELVGLLALSVLRVDSWSHDTHDRLCYAGVEGVRNKHEAGEECGATWGYPVGLYRSIVRSPRGANHRGTLTKPSCCDW